jgi:asparagine synthase (glutamine-hydrolysing)
MCGICGIYRFRDEHDDTASVHAMAERLVPRGPDDAGVVYDGAATLGNRRLAILDLSSAGHQPMQSASGRFWITFNGEIYNYRDVARELGLDECSLRSRTDTEVILHAWERWGVDALAHFVGQWAFALYDRDARQLWLARDRFGEKPLFYHRSREALMFASSIPALLQAPGVAREIDPETLFEYVSMRYVVAPRTVLSGIEKLPGGHVMRVDADGTEMQRWYAPKFRRSEQLARRSKNDLVDEFDTLLVRAAKRCLVSDVPVALLLSDGIDSNSIRAALRQAGDDVPCYTFAATGEQAVGAVESVPEATLIRSAARDRSEWMIPAFRALTEPTGDGAALATWVLIRGAREHATVFLCGHGGDEVLGGYRMSQDRFRLALIQRLARFPEAWSRGLVERFVYGAESRKERLQRMRRARNGHAPAAARYIINQPLPPPALRELYARDDLPGPYLQTIDRLYSECDEHAADLDRMQEVMLHTFLSTNILSFADAVAMDSSAELRMPFLDRDLVDFVLSLPPRLRAGSLPGRWNTKIILRHWARERVDRAVVRRRKRGFQYGSLPELVANHGDTLRDCILGVDSLRRLLPGVEAWLAHPPGYWTGPTEGTLWALLALGIWCEGAGVQ